MKTPVGDIEESQQIDNHKSVAMAELYLRGVLVRRATCYYEHCSAIGFEFDIGISWSERRCSRWRPRLAFGKHSRSQLDLGKGYQSKH